MLHHNLYVHVHFGFSQKMSGCTFFSFLFALASFAAPFLFSEKSFFFNIKKIFISNFLSCKVVMMCYVGFGSVCPGQLVLVVIS